MSTYMEKAGQVERKWYVIDARGKTLGRVAAQAAVLLRGKHKPTFIPPRVAGHVIITNCAKADADRQEAGAEEMAAAHWLDQVISRRPTTPL